MKNEKCLKAYVLAMLLCLLPYWALAQNFTIKGNIKDIQGEPIIGASVLVAGTTNGTISDLKGNYVLRVFKNSKLVISYVGYQTQNIDVVGRSTINIVLKEDSKTLNEVVVVGYGTQKKETLTGSVVNVGGAEIKKSPSPNVESSLAGKLPGLIVSQRSGEPGRDDPTMLIRGYGTFGDSSPLIIVDGVERTLMSRLNPDDIESVSVLKDASAAIYGARAANGVILVTTKKGDVGKPVFNLTMNTAMSHPTKVPQMLDAATFAEAYNEGYWYRQGRPTSDYVPFYSDEAIQKYREGSDPILYPNTNWMDEVLKSHSTQNRVSLQVTGGTEAVRYLLSFGTTTQGSDYRHDPTNYKQYNFRSNITINLNKYLTVGANINAILNDKKYPRAITHDNFYNIMKANPTLVARYPNGLLAGGRLGQSPLLLDQQGYDKIKDDPLYSTFTATLRIPHIDGLRIEGSFNYDLRNQFEKVFVLPYSYYEYNVNTSEYDKKQIVGTVINLTDTYSRWTTMLYNYRFVYDKKFKQHHIGAMLGQEQQKNTYSYAMAYRKNFVSDAIDQINVGSSASEDKNNGGSASNTARNNYMGRFNYDFASKYLAEFVFRYDGSCNFSPGKRYGFFPAGSIGWRISEEPFMKKAMPFVDQLKLRFSLGKTGNDKINSYQYLQSYSFGNNYVFGTTDASAIYANTMPNTGITWEISTKADLGLDASMWNGKLGFELTLFKEKRSKILAARNLSVPNTLGFSGLPDENIGKVDNHGFELKVTHRNKINDLTYNLEGNISYARNKIKYMDETPNTEAYQNQTGRPVGASLFYKSDGIFHTQEELDAYPHVTGTEIGDIKIIDLNNDGVIDSNDQYRFKYTATPEIVFGFNASFQYHNFDLSIFLQGQTKAYNYDSDFASLGDTAFDNTYTYRAKNRWTVDNPSGTMPRADNYTPGTTDFFLYDATFIRLKTVELGYSLPKKIATMCKFSDLRFYISGFNLLTWAKDIKWGDPELSGESLYYPQQRVINFGINLKF